MMEIELANWNARGQAKPGFRKVLLSSYVEYRALTTRHERRDFSIRASNADQLRRLLKRSRLEMARHVSLKHVISC
jgi:hypothetical protein